MDPLHALTLGDVLREHGRSWPLHTAVVDGEVRLTYRQLDARVDRLVTALAGAGVGTGDRVLWLAQGSFRLLEVLLATARLGAMVCPANWRQTAEELAFVVDDLDPRVVVWQEERIGDVARETRSRTTGQGARWLQHDGAGADGYEALLAAAPAATERAVDPASPVMVMYTAAFSGRPNGAMLSHTALIGQGLLFGRFAGIDSSYVFLNSGPLFHIATFFSTLATFVHAGTNVFVRRTGAEELCRVIDAERCTGAFVVGPTMEAIRDANADGRYDLSSLRTFAGPRWWNEMVTVDASPWSQRPGGYGQTEVTGLLTFAALGEGAEGAHGRTSPLLQLRVVDADDREVQPGEVGEIVARGPLVMSGYWNRPDENARRLRGGWHHTDDLGRREADGSLTFIGPKTRLIKSGAENVYPTEVEACVKTHPAVADCAVIGVPDPRWTQSVKAVVVVRPGASVTADEIVEHCRARIASYKKPRSVEVVDELPRAGLAVDYDALDARFGGGGYPGEGTAAG